MFATPAYAQTAGGASAAGGMTAMFLQMAPLVMIFIIFWFLMIRPQQLKAKEHRAMIDAVKKGDSVVTGGGLMGKVTKVDGETVEIEIASGVKVKAVKSTLADITPWSTGKAAND